MNKHLVVAALLLAPIYAQAHTFLVKPDQAFTQPGETLQVSVLMTEKLYAGERLLDVDSVQLRVLDGSGEHALELRPDAQAKALRATLTAPEHSAVLVAKAAPRYRALEKGKQTEDPAKTLRIESFAKTLINPQAGDAGFARASGDRLELIPLDNPAELDAGDTLRVQVLLDGKALAGKVMAMSPDQERVAAQTDAEGIASLILPAAGFWVVRVKHESEESDARSAHYEATASLVLAID